MQQLKTMSRLCPIQIMTETILYVDITLQKDPGQQDSRKGPQEGSEFSRVSGLGFRTHVRTHNEVPNLGRG